MKTAVSIPDDVFEDAERLARRLNLPRSHLCTEAIREYIARRDPDATTEALNRLADTVDTRSDPAVAGAASRILQGTEW